MDPVSRRLMTELRDFRQGRSPQVRQLGPEGDSLTGKWRAVLRGPDDSPYAGGHFRIDIRIPENYPMKPPTFKFATPICHPNVNFKTGEICLDILFSNWSPSWTLHSTCMAICVLLSNPEPASPLNCDAGNLLRCGDVIAFNSLAAMYTKLYANAGGDDDDSFAGVGQ